MTSEILFEVSNSPLEVSISSSRPIGLEPSILFCFSFSLIYFFSLFEPSILEEYLENGLLVIEVRSCPLLPRHVIPGVRVRRGEGGTHPRLLGQVGTLCGDGKDCCPCAGSHAVVGGDGKRRWGIRDRLQGNGGHRSLK